MRDDKLLERTKIVADYISAYEAANGIKCPYVIRYSSGWYRILRDGFNMAAWRKADILKNTATLRYRNKGA